MGSLPVAFPARARPSRVRPLIGAGFVAVYLLLDWLSNLHAVAPYAFTPWNPPPGLSLALLLGLGLQYSPFVLVATLLAEFVIHDPGGSLAPKVLYALILTGGYTAMAYVLERGLRFDRRLAALRELVLLTVAVAGGTALIAMAYVGAHVVTGKFAWDTGAGFIRWFWVGDAIGIMVLTPFALVHALRAREAPLRLNLEVIVQALGLAATLALVFSAGDAAAARYFYLLFVPLIWIAVRHGFEGASAAIFGLQLGLIGLVQLAGYASGSVLELQMLMLALAVTGLFLGMAVSERRQARDALAHREAELKTIVLTAPDGILTFADDGRILTVNAAGLALFGLRADGVGDVFLARLLPELPATPDTAQLHETRAVRADGVAFPAEVAIGTATFAGRRLHVAVVRDVTQRQAIEARLEARERELNRAMRLAAASEMASALAHELHQPLTAATTYVQACELMVQRSGHHDAQLFDAMHKAVTEVKRAGAVVKKLRDFYSGGTSRPETVSVSELCDNALRALHNRIERHGVGISLELPEDLPPVRVDRVQFEMVVHNLLANAIDSMVAGNTAAPRIIITARARDEHAVELAVQDTGPGVPAETADTLFEAFATSKPDGMGMGLAISRSIVEHHGGRLWLEKAGAGALFKLTLPRTKDNDE